MNKTIKKIRRKNIAKSKHAKAIVFDNDLYRKTTKLKPNEDGWNWHNDIHLSKIVSVANGICAIENEDGSWDRVLSIWCRPIKKGERWK